MRFSIPMKFSEIFQSPRHCRIFAWLFLFQFAGCLLHGQSNQNPFYLHPLKSTKLYGIQLLPSGNLLIVGTTYNGYADSTTFIKVNSSGTIINNTKIPYGLFPRKMSFGMLTDSAFVITEYPGGCCVIPSPMTSVVDTNFNILDTSTTSVGNISIINDTTILLSGVLLPIIPILTFAVIIRRLHSFEVLKIKGDFQITLLNRRSMG